MKAKRDVVMVVEDDAELNELERQLLAAHGLDSVPAYSGMEALEMARLNPSDGVLLDVMLPEMDGFEACRRLRCEQVRRLPIVLLTALDSEDSRRRGHEAGADAYFTKPFDPDQLIGALRELLEGSMRGSTNWDGSHSGSV